MIHELREGEEHATGCQTRAGDHQVSAAINYIGGRGGTS